MTSTRRSAWAPSRRNWVSIPAYRVDPKTDDVLDKPVLRSGRGLMDAMNTDEVGFSSMDVYAAFNEFNDPVLIVRIYTPWQ